MEQLLTSPAKDSQTFVSQKLRSDKERKEENWKYGKNKDTGST